MQAYTAANWPTIERLIADRSAGRTLARDLQIWRADGVAKLNASLTYTKRVGPRRYVVSIRLAADPRVIPYWVFYLVQVDEGRARVLRPVTGLSGPNYARATWTVDQTAHFVVYHSPYELEGADRRYVGDLELQRATFVKKFRVTLPPRAYLYLYPDPASMQALTRRSPEPCGVRPEEIGCTYAYVRPPTIHALVEAIFHEAIHVFQLSLVPPSHIRGSVYVAPLFVGEGMAVALQDPEVDPRLSDYCSELRYVPLDTCARSALRRVNPMTILSDRGFKASNPVDAYALGGSFAKYLILRYGYVRYGRFYYRLAGRPSDTLRDYDAASSAVYGKRIRALVAAWRTSLCGTGC
jgi:hypothetical protein